MEDIVLILSEIMTCRDYVPLVNLIGVCFQIRDDYMNLKSSEVSPYPQANDQ